MDIVYEFRINIALVSDGFSVDGLVSLLQCYFFAEEITQDFSKFLYRNFFLRKFFVENLRIL